MCLQTTWKEPKVAGRNIKVYKVLEYWNEKRMSPYNFFEYELGKEYSTIIERTTDGSSFDTMAIEAKEKLYNIGPGFHSASTAERLDDLFDDQVIVECIIPKGSKYYRGLSGLLVSDRIIIKKEI